MTFLASWLEWLLLSFLFPGGRVFDYFQRVYNRSFDSNHRLPLTDETPLADIEDSKVVGRKRRPCHTVLRSFGSKRLALEYWLTASPVRDSLSNIHLLSASFDSPHSPSTFWDFILVGSPEQVPSKWFSGESRDLDWKRIQVPGHWQLQGFDVPIYTNTMYPFQFDPPRARRTGSWKVTDCDSGLSAQVSSASLPSKELGPNTTGLYRRRFNIPHHWKHSLKQFGSTQDRVSLVFEGVDSCLTCWLNGKFVGYSQDSCLPAEFDVTDHLCWDRSDGSSDSSGVNEICVQVSRWCDGSYLEDQDKWWLSGIYREVYLIRKPHIFISDFEVTTDLLEVDVNDSSEGSTAPTDSANTDPNSISASASASASAPVDGESATIQTGQESDSQQALREKDPPPKKLVAGIDISVCVEAFPAVNVIDLTDKHAIRAELWKMGDEPEFLSSTCCPLIKGQALPVRTIADSVENSYGAEIDFDAPSFDCLRSGALHFVVHDPHLWSAEDPFLHVVVLSLHSSLELAEEGVGDIDVESCRVGLRDVKISGEQNVLSVNGQPITIAGVNRHEFDPDFGRWVSESVMRQDVQLMKQLNFNAVRCSHYPPHPRWLELCDEAGLYVVDEANIETHGFQTMGQPVGYLSNHLDWKDAMLSRVTRMFERDKNSTAVIAWSLGNESGLGTAHESMSSWLRLRDPRRVIQYESGGARSSVTDIICPMYQRLPWCRREALHDPQRRPVILCEYSHAMGNSGGSLLKYWRDFRNPHLPRMQGGFVWDWVDQGIRLPDSSGFGYGGDFGDVPNTKQFCINGILGPDRKPHPAAFEVAFHQAPVLIELLRATPFSAGLSAASATVNAAPDSIASSDSTASSDPVKGGVPAVSSRETTGTSRGRRSERSKRRATNDDSNYATSSTEEKDSVSSTPPSSTSSAESLATQSNQKKEELCMAVLNRRSHTDLGDLVVSIALRCDVMGPRHQVTPKVLQRDPIVVGSAAAYSVLSMWPSLDPNGSGGLRSLARSMNLSVTQLYAAKELWLEVIVSVAVDTPWVPKGHIVYERSLSHPDLMGFLKEIISKADSAPPAKKRDCSESNAVSFEVVLHDDEKNATFFLDLGPLKQDVVRIVWKSGAWAVVGVTCGRLLRWVDEKGKRIIDSPIDVCLWRAPTDNDYGGGALSFCSQWKAAGLHCLHRSPNVDWMSWMFYGSSADENDAIAGCGVVKEQGSVMLEAAWTLQPSTEVACPRSIFINVIYEFGVSGEIGLNLSVSVPVSMPSLPRVGIRFSLPGEYQQVQWLGLGPHEAYPDRKSCVRLGCFESRVDALHTPYVFPQECGTRMDPRWVYLREASGNRLGRGLLMVPNPEETEVKANPMVKVANKAPTVLARDVGGWGWSASLNSLEALDQSAHDHELLIHRDGKVHVHLDCRVMGVGGYDSWSPNVDAEHQVLSTSTPFELNFLLFPLKASQSPAEVYEDYNRGVFNSDPTVK